MTEKAINDPARKRLVLLDSHAILHRAYHALPDFVSAKGEPTGALYGLVTMLLSAVAELKPDYVVACYDLPGPTYRHEAYKEYKAGRVKSDPALISQMKRSRDVFDAFNIPIYDKPGFEADDMLGTIVERVLVGKGFENIDIVIVSGDMDTLQLVTDKRVQVYTLKKGIKDTILYDEDAVRERFGFGPELLPDYKGLRGDPSDNIIGIKGIGEKTATTLITTFGSIEKMYEALGATGEDGAGGASVGGHAAFKKAGISPRMIELLEKGKEEADFSKMLATIRRDAPIDFVLPEKMFKEGLDVAKANALFTELDFRTMGVRLKNVLEGKTSGKTAGAAKKDAANNVNGDVAQPEAEKPPLFAGADPHELREVQIALWILDSNLTNPGPEEIASFAQTEDFAKAREIIISEVDKRGLGKVYRDIELPIIPILDKMRDRGVLIDRALLADLSKKYHIELDRLEKKIWELAGMEFNINSPKQLGEVLFDRLMLTAKGLKKTDGGARSTRESELEKMRDAHPVVPLIFEYREFQKLLSTYIDTIPTLLDEHDRLHGTFIQTGAATGRMASQNPNLQNIPIKTDLGRAIRGAFIAEKGFVLGAFDYSQIELRIAAFLSGDEKLISIFKSGEDVHTAVASEVFGVPKEKVDREMRRRAKVINFGILYGMGVNALRTNLGTDRATAQQFYNDYFAKFSGLAAYLDRVKAEAARRGYTETFFGRRRQFEGIQSKIPYVRAMAERMAINAPIQGTNADIVKIAMKKIDEYIESEGLTSDVYLLLQVHDELVYEIRDGKGKSGDKDSGKYSAEKIAEDIKRIMETVIDPKDISGIVCVANASLGKDWGSLK